jgi:hypothetical protein
VESDEGGRAVEGRDRVEARWRGMKGGVVLGRGRESRY